MGLTQPHPNAGCVLVDEAGRPVGEGWQLAQGTESAESAAARAAGGAAAGGTAYLCLEPGDCHGDAAAVRALLAARVSRAVIGLRHPLQHLRSAALRALRDGGMHCTVLGEARTAAPPGAEAAAAAACAGANEALLHRAALRRPLGLLKYAMTLDGKIATAQGHSAWVSSPESRARVFEARAASDAVVVGGQTVRRDNPRLTTRREGGHQPARVVMSRTLDLPQDAHLWDVSVAPTLVMTQRGARRDFQRALRALGVEVIEFDFLTPDAVSRYCYERGYLQVLWECGGTLAAPAISGGAIHKVMAFVAPKIIGGARAPTPVGDMGFVEMTQAIQLEGTRWEASGPDLLLTGYLPLSGGPAALAASLAAANPPAAPGVAEPAAAGGANGDAPGPRTHKSRAAAASGGGSEAVVEFYKAWDRHGALGNFTPHSVCLPAAPMTTELLDAAADAAPDAGMLRVWPSVEHYYQAQKFSGVDSPEACALVEEIATAPSPEAAARLGRGAERSHPHLLRADWPEAKVPTMLAALRSKFGSHDGPRAMLLATAAPGGAGAGEERAGPALLVEAAPHDFFWGRGLDGSGQNWMGRLLAQVRGELLEAEAAAAAAAVPAAEQPASMPA